MEIAYNKLSELTGYTYRTVKKRLDAAGLKPIRKEGPAILFDSALALKAIYNQTLIDTPETDEESNYSLLLEKEKYREKKRQNDLEEGKVAPVNLLTDAITKTANQMIPILETLPLMIKRNFPEITGDQIQLVKKSIVECRNIISDMEVDIEE